MQEYDLKLAKRDRVKARAKRRGPRLPDKSPCPRRGGHPEPRGEGQKSVGVSGGPSDR